MPYQNVMMRNVPIVLNILPMLDQHAQDATLSRLVAPQLSAVVRDTLTRHVGRLLERRSAAANNAGNPLHWFVAGVRFCLALPFSLLVAFGLLTPTRREHALSSRGFQIVNGLVALGGGIAVVVGLLADLEDAVQLLRSLF